MTERRPVADWATDFDHLSDEWAAHSTEILADLRVRCPVAHTDRFHGAYLVSRYDDVVEIAHSPNVFSNRVTLVNENHPDNIKLSLAPLTLDPPEHAPVRRALLPAFAPRRIAELEPFLVDMVNGILDGLEGRAEVDGAREFAELVPVGVMSHLYGVGPEMGRQFRRWVDEVIKEGLLDLERARVANREVQAYFIEQLRARRDDPRDDLVTLVLEAQVTEDDGTTRGLTEREQVGALYVLMIGGIDTTWSLIGAALFHLATHPGDLAKLVADPSLIPNATEEFLRYYSPATLARVITEDAEIAGCPLKAGERVLIAFPSANRDDAYFERADEVVFEREHNRHVAFGVGIHRCLGSNLARLEINVALSAWLARFPRFELAVDPSAIQWSIGPVRGPRSVPLRILPAAHTATTSA